MEFNAVNFLAGMLIGVAGTSIVWLIVKMTIDGHKNKVKAEQNALINSIGETLVRIDMVLTSHRTGTISEEQFKRSLSDAVNTVNREFKPNMHLFDVYYVKYIDALMSYYSEFLRGRITPIHYENKDEFEASHEPVKTAAIIAPAEVVQVQKPETVAPVADAIPDVSFEVDNEAEVVAEDLQVVDVAPQKTARIIVDIDSNVDSFEVAEEQDVQSQPPVITTEKTEHLKVLPVDDADMPEFAAVTPDTVQSDLEHESEEIAAASVPMDQAADISFDEMAKDVLSNEPAVEDEAVDFIPVNAMSQTAQTVPLPAQDEVTENRESEEFTMETIMDLDMSKIPSFNTDTSKIVIRKPSSGAPFAEPQVQSFSRMSSVPPTPQTAVPPQYAGNAPVRVPNAFNNDSSIAFVPTDRQNAAGQYAERQHVPTPVIRQDLRKEADHGKDDVAITGDDVADQIDNFFGFGK